jgi:hypothetical protein
VWQRVDGASRLVESDSSTLVLALKTSDYDLSEFGVLLRGIRSSCILHFDDFEFCFYRCDCNKVTCLVAIDVAELVV